MRLCSRRNRHRLCNREIDVHKKVQQWIYHWTHDHCQINTNNNIQQQNHRTASNENLSIQRMISFREHQLDGVNKNSHSQISNIKSNNTALKGSMTHFQQEHETKNNEAFREIKNDVRLLNTMTTMLARNSNCTNMKHFDGNPKHWPEFIRQYKLTTESCEFSSAENIHRLSKCSTGEALSAVQNLLLVSNNDEDIIRILQTRFGRPELIIGTMVTESRNLAKVHDWCSFINFSMVVQNLAVIIDGHSNHIYNPELYLQHYCINYQKHISCNGANF